MHTRTLLHLPYHAARMPLAVMDAKLVKRLPADSPPRLAFERILGSLDVVAGRVLNDRHVEDRGAQLRDHADLLGDAVELEHDAAQRRSAAQETVRQAEQQAESLRAAAQREQREGVHEAVENEREEKQAAARRARAQASAAKQQADARAANRLAAVEQKRRQAEAGVQARTSRAVAAAKSELDEAAEKRSAARARRAEADELGKLSNAKQQARKS
jgi:hypothetical protein